MNELPLDRQIAHAIEAWDDLRGSVRRVYPGGVAGWIADQLELTRAIAEQRTHEHELTIEHLQLQREEQRDEIIRLRALLDECATKMERAGKDKLANRIRAELLS